MTSTPFDLLGLPARFDLDRAEIERAYLARSAALHPDLARADDDAARRMAALNDARRTLADPERRAAALLERLGGAPPESERALPPGFLIEIMETREEIEAAAGDPAERRRWEAWAAERRQEAVAEIGALFRALPDPPASAALAAIRQRLNAWRYIERLIEQLDPDHRADAP